MAGWSPRKLENQFISELVGLYSPGEASEICRLLMEDQYAWSRTRLLMERDSPVDEQPAEAVLRHLPALQNGTPVQYLLGYAWFLDMKLQVSPAVLIPRPETEELVHRISTDYQHEPGMRRIIDIGTGSGCIALGLKKLLPQAEVYAMDVSADALAIARANATAQALDIQFIQADILEWDAFFDPAQRFDIVVSNPPYITEAEQASMHANVLQHEPHLALFVQNENPLLFYAHIASFATAHLVPNGQVYVEINASLGSETSELYRKKEFYPVAVHTDMQGRDRFIQAQKPA